jgi:hypothetical protein
MLLKFVTKNYLMIILIGILLYLIKDVTTYIWLNSLLFDGFPYDGPFQNIYPLRRIDNGDLPGKDFLFFHGNGIPYVHYIFYKIFGSNIFASELSVAILQFIMTVFPVFFILKKLCDLHSAIFFTLCYIFISFNGLVFSSLSPIFDLSTFGIRAAFPLIVASYLYINYGTENKVKVITVTSVLLLIAILLGTEQGVYAFGSVAMLILIFNYFNVNIISRIIYTLLFSAIFSIILIGFHLLFFGDLDALIQIKNLSNDQSWYFGIYPHVFIKNINDFFTLSNVYLYETQFIVFVYSLIFLFTLYLYTKYNNLRRQLLICLYLLVYGLGGAFSNFGMIAYHYMEPMIRSSAIVVCYYLYLSLQMIFMKTNSQQEPDIL